MGGRLKGEEEMQNDECTWAEANRDLQNCRERRSVYRHESPVWTYIVLYIVVGA